MPDWASSDQGDFGKLCIYTHLFYIQTSLWIYQMKYLKNVKVCLIYLKIHTGSWLYCSLFLYTSPKHQNLQAPQSNFSKINTDLEP